MTTASLASLVGLLVGLGLNPLATWLPQIGRDPAELATGEGIYVRLSFRRFILPALNALLYGWIGWRAGGDWRVVTILAIYSTLFLLVAIVDLETRLIPNVLILPAIGLALLSSTVDPRLSFSSALLGCVTGFLLFYVIALVARGGFGAGDVKLSAFIGAVAGFPAVLLALVAGIFIGGIVAVLLLLTGRATRKTYMPYGPFLCVGGWYAMLWGDRLFWNQFG